ncbi:NAD(P)/FAD-dependent oxidoreductase [uncultured Halopseudomonas sp.]|uniref:NAD(P)/FAD-dependent oxidoreductase n=1 Tax=uncultured Halopseudomonas sp. TaxID=2901193 RepID=UPI0030EC0CC7|tara:strand:- start:9150 stop:10313 length:1164 start_codon:yes stop_codon:yes gene_type:complete
MTDMQTVVVGAGVVGLAIAQRLAAAGHDVLVLEQEAWSGQHASSRNSEVIHAGLYYRPGSLKARLCVEGRDLLYSWCAEHGVPHRRIGKLLVAVEEAEVPALRALHANAAASGTRLEWLDADEVVRIEPEVRAVAGLYSPLTGIVDSHALMQSLEASLQAAGGSVSYRTQVQRVVPVAGGFCLEGTSAGEPFSLSCRYLINACGVFAQQLAAGVQDLPGNTVPALHLCQGRYLAYSGNSPFSHLVYPMPAANTAGLGVHATLDLAGQVRFGPDVKYLQQIDYSVEDGLVDGFARAIQRYWPGCKPDRLVPGYAGVRAKLSGPGEAPADFVIQDHREHGMEGLIQLFGIESPGLTASLALAREVAMRLDKLYPMTKGQTAQTAYKEHP